MTSTIGPTLSSKLTIVACVNPANRFLYFLNAYTAKQMVTLIMASPDTLPIWEFVLRRVSPVKERNVTVFTHERSVLSLAKNVLAVLCCFAASPFPCWAFTGALGGGGAGAAFGSAKRSGAASSTSPRL